MLKFSDVAATSALRLSSPQTSILNCPPTCPPGVTVGAACSLSTLQKEVKEAVVETARSPGTAADSWVSGREIDSQHGGGSLFNKATLLHLVMKRFLLHWFTILIDQNKFQTIWWLRPDIYDTEGSADTLEYLQWQVFKYVTALTTFLHLLLFLNFKQCIFQHCNHHLNFDLTGSMKTWFGWRPTVAVYTFTVCPNNLMLYRTELPPMCYISSM